MPLSDVKAFRYNLIGSFFNQTLPSSIGGDAVRLWLVNRTGAGWRAATYSILTDRAVGLIALAVIIVASLPWSYGMIGDAKGRLALVLVDLAAGLGTGLLAAGTSTLGVVEELAVNQARARLFGHRQPGDLQQEECTQNRRAVVQYSHAGSGDRLVLRARSIRPAGSNSCSC